MSCTLHPDIEFVPHSEGPRGLQLTWRPGVDGKQPSRALLEISIDNAGEPEALGGLSTDASRLPGLVGELSALKRDFVFPDGRAIVGPDTLYRTLRRAEQGGAKLYWNDGSPASSRELARTYSIKAVGLEKAHTNAGRRGGVLRLLEKRALESSAAVAIGVSLLAGSLANQTLPILFPAVTTGSLQQALLTYPVLCAGYWVSYFSLLRWNDRKRFRDIYGVLDLERYQEERRKDLPNFILGELFTSSLRIASLQMFTGLFGQPLAWAANIASSAVTNAAFLTVLRPLREFAGPALMRFLLNRLGRTKG